MNYFCTCRRRCPLNYFCTYYCTEDYRTSGTMHNALLEVCEILVHGKAGLLEIPQD